MGSYGELYQKSDIDLCFRNQGCCISSAPSLDLMPQLVELRGCNKWSLRSSSAQWFWDQSLSQLFFLFLPHPLFIFRPLSALLRLDLSPQGNIGWTKAMGIICCILFYFFVFLSIWNLQGEKPSPCWLLAATGKGVRGTEMIGQSDPLRVADHSRLQRMLLPGPFLLENLGSDLSKMLAGHSEPRLEGPS